MRCPKCHYLSFEPEPRCKNCGYDLSLGSGDLLFKPADQPEETFADFDLHVRDNTPKMSRPLAEMIEVGAPSSSDLAQLDLVHASAAASAPAAALESLAMAEPVQVTPVAPPSPSRIVTTELPLFVQGLPQPGVDQGDLDEPLVKLPRAPRPPLSVRRPTPAPGRVKEKYQQRDARTPRQVGLLERDLLEGTEVDRVVATVPAAGPREGTAGGSAGPAGRAGRRGPANRSGHG